MTASERLTVRGPEDILGFIPHSLGYWPSSSLVAMTMHGTTLGATLRVDLPGPEAPSDPAAFARAVRRYLESDQDADGALLAVFTSDGAMALPSPYDPLVSAVQSALEQAGMPVREAWFVGGKYWRDALCDDALCCPLPGRPIQEILDSTLNTEMVYRGSSVGPAPRLGSPPQTQAPVPAMHLAAVLEAQAGWEAELGALSGSRAQFIAVLRFWQKLLDRVAADAWLPDIDRDAFLRATLLVPAWRDAVIVMAAAGRDAAEAGAELFNVFADADAAGGNGAGGSVVPIPLLPPPALPGTGRRTGTTGTRSGSVPAGHAEPAGYGEVLMGLAPEVPDWAGLDALDRVLGHVAAPGGQAAAAALTIRGWVAWCRGRGSYAAAHLGQALELEPQYRLAELLLEIVGRGTLCGWAARKEAAWQKFGEDPAGRTGAQ